ncbi:MAG: hypothetical protein ISR65_03465 [Bacteriovoracaceae bacterium]|nr:hypothetical protein [Bacteriovoracaceae bacterium]
MKNIIAALFVMIFSCQVAIASHLFIEPLVGYGLGNHEDTTVDKANGVYFGARTGVSFGLPFIGADFLMGMPTIIYKDSATSDVDSPSFSLGVVVGIEFLDSPFRLWGGYYFIDNATRKYSGGEVDVTGVAMKLGAGYSIFELVALNIEYIMRELAEYESGGSTAEFPANNNKVEIVFLSMSLPFTIAF